MSAKEGKEQLKIRQFEWYEVETKVREIMGELLQPFNKKQTEDTIKINEIKRNQAAMLKKLQDHDFLLERETAEKPTYIQLQDDKITSIEERVGKAELEMEGRVRAMEGVVAVYEDKVRQLNQLERRLDREVIERLEEFRKFKEEIDKTAELMAKRQDAQVEEVGQFKNQTKGTVGKMETRMIGFDNRLKELEDEQRHRASDVKRLVEDGAAYSERLVQLDLKVADLLARVEDREKDSRLSQKFFTRVKEVESEFRFISSFLEQYQPLYIQMQISDTLNSFLQGRLRRKLCIYEEQAFAKLHRHILLNQKLTLQDLMSAYTNNIRKIVNRNKKYVINLAVAESIKVGTSVYEFRIDNLADNDDEQNNKKQPPAPVNSQEIARVVAERVQRLEQEVKDLVKEELKPTHTWVSELQEQMLIRALDYDKRYEEAKRMLGEQSARQELEEKHVRGSLADLTEGHTQLEAVVGAVREYVRDILNFSSVINHIVIQDEIDRQGTALYALRSEKNEQLPPATLQLDPNCLNCDPKSAVVVQKAFKMACLTYNPSQIRIDDQMFSRQEILEISTGILEKLKKRLWNPETNKNTQEPPQRRTLLVEKAETKRRSASTLKEGALGSLLARGRDAPGLLPAVGGSSSRPWRERKAQLSVFY